jgi:hypothetical protein
MRTPSTSIQKSQDAALIKLKRRSITGLTFPVSTRSCMTVRSFVRFRQNHEKLLAHEP